MEMRREKTRLAECDGWADRHGFQRCVSEAGDAQGGSGRLPVKVFVGVRGRD